MDQISSADLLNLVLAQRSSIDQQFQSWLTITFAVIVAGFIAGPRLVPRLRLIVAVLYVMATAHLTARWMSDGITAGEWVKVLASRGVVYQVPWVAASLRMVLMLLGTVSALIFLFWHAKTNDVDQG
ncbi:MAG TPA: hypothetical protein VF277_00450 [Steroidobacteraceae bacterium]